MGKEDGSRCILRQGTGPRLELAGEGAGGGGLLAASRGGRTAQEHRCPQSRAVNGRPNGRRTPPPRTPPGPGGGAPPEAHEARWPPAFLERTYRAAAALQFRFRCRHFAVRQQRVAAGMLSTACYAEPRPELGYRLGAPVQYRFSPYTFNGGTVLAIAGEDFSIVASDTRLSEGYAIHSRDSPKCYKLTEQTIIGCSGFHGDCLTLTKIIEARLKMYKHSNNKTMTTGAIAAMLSTILYSRRFFPYYVYNIIGGLDEEGKGAVYSFDPVGSYQRDSFKAGGSASAMLQPLLDNQIGFKNMQNVEHVPLTLEKALQLVKDVFISAAERDVYTGDALKICIVTKDGIKEETVQLRKD